MSVSKLVSLSSRCLQRKEQFPIRFPYIFSRCLYSPSWLSGSKFLNDRAASQGIAWVTIHVSRSPRHWNFSIFSRSRNACSVISGTGSERIHRSLTFKCLRESTHRRSGRSAAVKAAADHSSRMARLPDTALVCFFLC